MRSARNCAPRRPPASQPSPQSSKQTPWTAEKYGSSASPPTATNTAPPRPAPRSPPKNICSRGRAGGGSTDTECCPQADRSPLSRAAPPNYCQTRISGRTSPQTAAQASPRNSTTAPQPPPQNFRCPRRSPCSRGTSATKAPVRARGLAQTYVGPKRARKRLMAAQPAKVKVQPGEASPG